LRVEKGGSIANSTAFAINGPFEAGLYQVFAGSGAVTGFPFVKSVWFLPLQKAVNAVVSGGKLDITSANSLTEFVDVTSPIHITGNTTITQTVSGKGIFNITSDDVLIENITMVGAGNTSYSAYGDAVNIQGASSAIPADNVIIRNCKISGFGAIGIKAEFATNIKIENNHISEIGYTGIQFLSVIGADIVNNKIDDVSPGTGGNAYGISLTKIEANSLVDYPRTENIKVTGNTISNVPAWEGIDTHAGKNIIIDGNTINGCRYPISIVPADNGSQVSTLASLAIVISNNTMDSGVTDGSFGEGIRVAGVSGGELTEVIIAGNTIKNHGAQSSLLSGGITARDTVGLVIGNNTIINPSPNGVAISSNNNNFNISGNSFIDVWSTTQATPRGVYSIDNGNFGLITGNDFGVTTNKTATYKLAYAAFLANKTGGIKYLRNYSQHTGAYEFVDIGFKATGLEMIVSKTFNWGSVASGAFASTTVPAAYAKIGDIVTPSMSVAVPAGCILTASVTAPDTVTVTLYNISGVAVDLDSGTLFVNVLR
jgi:hypothetical protein